MASSSSSRPHSTPMPVGPHILWPVKAEEVGAQLGHVGGEVGHVLAGVDHARGRRRRGRRRRGGATGVRVPSTFDMAVNAEQLGAVEQPVEVGRGRAWPSAATRDPAQLDAALGGEHRATGRCWRGARAAVSTTTSPAPRLARPQELATRLSASVAFLVNTTSPVRRRADEARRPWPGPPRAARWPPRRCGRRRGARWRWSSRSSASIASSTALGLLRTTRRVEVDDRLAVDLAGRGAGSPCGWPSTSRSVMPPPCVVALALEPLGQLGAAGVDDAAVDQDVHDGRAAGGRAAAGSG